MNDQTDSVNPTVPNDKMKTVAKAATRFLSSAVVRVAEGAILVYVGTLIGNSITNHTIVNDCQQVATAKAGERYIKCDLVPLKKEPETSPPR
jgi:hypothetical protein